MGLTLHEENALRQAKQVITRNPDGALRYLAGNAPNIDKALLCLVLSALLEHTRQHNEITRFALAVTEFVKKT